MRARTIITAARWPIHRQALVAEAAAGLLAARLLSATRPFHAIARRWGEPVPTDEWLSDKRQPPSPRAVTAARRVAWAVTAVAPHLPFRAVCLQQAMAAHRMLSRRGVAAVVHVGVLREPESPVETHVWLEVAGVPVTGYPLPATLTELARIA